MSALLKLTGSLQSVIKWLVELQRFEAFQALKSAEDPPTVSLELEVARCYSP